MLGHWFVSDLKIVGTTRDVYGDLAYSNQRTVKGRILLHGAIILNDRKEQQETDAFCWLEPDEEVTTDTIIQYQNENYRIVKIIDARRGGEEAIQFKKCLLEKFTNVVGIS